MLRNLAIGASAMVGQSKAMENISSNIANLNTNGYKASHIQFKTLIGDKVASENQTGGMQPIQRQTVSTNGLISNTGNDLDIALSGPGMLILSGKENGKTTVYYGRDGSLHTQIAKDGATEMVDKNNKNLQAYMYDDATESYSPNLSSVRFDEGKPIPARTSSAGTVMATLPALSKVGENTLDASNKSAGESVKMNVNGINPAGQSQVMHINLVHTGRSEWTLNYDGPAGSDGKPTTITEKAQFNTKGELVSPRNIKLGWGVNTRLELQQNGESYVPGRIDINGHEPGYISKVTFDENGILYGHYNNGRVSPLAKIPVARFINANGLSAETGNIYKETDISGTPLVSKIEDMGGKTTFVPNSVELSNTDLGTSFSNMIKTQQAYSAASKIITTYDSMEQTTSAILR